MHRNRMPFNRRWTGIPVLMICAGFIVLSPPTCFGQSVYPRLTRANFTEAAPQGFGDRQNSWAWSMQWFNNQLYVGTNRANACVNAEAAHQAIPSSPYPPKDPDLSCAPDPTDLPLQAEIWAWNPITNIWTRVYQSPNDVPIPNTSPQKYTAQDQGFRGMTVFTESDGTQALYVSGCIERNIYGIAQTASLLRSVDGVNFAPVPADPGTFLGNYGANCYRGMTTYNNKLYLVGIQSPGVNQILEAANPEQGDDAFRAVTAPGLTPIELASFNGYLYISFADAVNGFTVSKTNAQGNPPYALTPIITNGGYKNPYPNKGILSMLPFNGSLYLGGDNANPGAPFAAQTAELFRANADDSWDLIAGVARSTPDGQKNPLSGLGAGFGWGLNAHMWRMANFDGRLYVGTFDESTVLRNIPIVGPAIAPELGFDLWYAWDGVHFNVVDYQGFQDKFNMGLRTFAATPYGLFVGTANWYYGLEIWQGVPTGFKPPASP